MGKAQSTGPTLDSALHSNAEATEYGEFRTILEHLLAAGGFTLLDPRDPHRLRPKRLEVSRNWTELRIESNEP